MDTTRIEYALSLSPDTKNFVIGEGVSAGAPEVFKRDFPGRDALIVTDSVIFQAAGRGILKAFKAAGLSREEPYIFPGEPVLHAEYELVLELASALEGTDAVPVAVGSGTVNDLVKLASHLVGRPYLVIPTAASVDGYSSYGAAIVKDGFKQTIECRAPKTICADTRILKGAPSSMTAAGYGDLSAKLIAGSDWIISEAVTGEKIDITGWDLVQTGLKDCVAMSGKLSEGEAVEAVFSGLAMTGFAMQITKSSRPVSGAEHLFSHIWEMENLEKDGIPVFHGAKVALGTLAAASLTEEVFKRKASDFNVKKRLETWPAWEKREAEIRGAFAHLPQALPQLIEINRKKFRTHEELLKRYQNLAELWAGLKKRVEAQLLPYEKLLRRFREAGCPTLPEEISLTRERFFRTFHRAQMLRDRFTVLDLAYELGILPDCVEAIQNSRRYFG